MSNPAKAMILDREQALVLVIDIQERLAAAMPPERMERVKRNARALIEGAKALDLPVVVTEQYRKGIGPTVPEVAECLAGLTEPIDKVDFSCGAVPRVMERIRATGRTQLVLCGMETHVCVYQTARDLLGEEFAVYVPADAVVSRSEENLHTGLQLMERAGAVVSSTETVLFDLVKRAGTPEFKAIQKLIK